MSKKNYIELKKAYLEFINELFIDYRHPQTSLSTQEWLSIGERYGFENVIGMVLKIRSNPDSNGFIIRVSEIERLLNGTKSNRASLAWSKLMAVIDRSTAYLFVFDDPLLHVTIDSIGGWEAVCSWRVDELGFKQNEFSKHYETAERLSAIPKYTPVFSLGVMVSETIPVGDRSKCEKVYRLEFVGAAQENSATPTVLIQ